MDNKEPLKESLRLGYLVPEFPTQTHNFFWKEIGALRAQGITVRLFSTRRPEIAVSPHPFRDQALKETTYLFPPSGLRFIRFALIHPVLVARAFQYLHSLSEASLGEKVRLAGLIPSAIELLLACHAEKIGHIHCHSCASAAHLVNICHRMGGPPFSLSLHGDLPVYGKDQARKMADAQFVACVTKPLQNDVMELTGKPPQQVPVIRMGVDTTLFTPARMRPSAPGKLTLVTVARLNPAKGIEHVFNALFQAKQRGYEIMYLVAGEGPDRKRLEALIATLQLGDSVRLLGTTGEREVIALLQNADAFALPSTGLGEAAPVSVMEAMACGLPVVCSIIGGTPEMISDGIDGFLAPQRDETALLNAFTRLADDVALRKRIGENARARALREFDYIEMAKQLLRHIRSEATPAEN
jgi:glycosyltransferase involved in cell wall biosynthesis